MAFLNASILFLTALLGGIIFLSFPMMRRISLKNILIFAGSYLFSITIIHLLPEVFLGFPNPVLPGIFILGGFFLQLILEFLSEGIEHGHIHSPSSPGTHISASHILSLMAGLSLHSFLEGMIVSSPPGPGIHHHSGGILLGIVLHKIPEVFALMAIVYFSDISRLKSFMILLIFSLTSPAGLIFSYFLFRESSVNPQFVSILYGIVSGTFLFISTTIFYESSPGHRFNPGKLLFAVAGGLLAVILELFIQ